ncbi:MAG: hypothetical protein KAG94_00150 [Clostridiales bacterium]|nr:hypothetical protein [Clostridiales bacterium]
MKKKKLLIGIICLTMILSVISSSCNKEENQPSSSPSQVASETPTETPPLLLEDLAKFGVTLNKLLVREENYTQYPYISEWETYINENYNIDIKVNFVNIGFQYFTDYYIQNKDESNATGIVYLSDFRGIGDIQKLIDRELIVPLTEMVAKNPTFNKMPTEFKNMYLFGDGEIWAIPGEIRYNGYLVRLTKTDWLEALNLDVPTSYAELLRVSRRFTTHDPDGDGKDNTYGLNTTNDYTFRGLQDLFNANGVYLNTNSDYSTAYNPTTGTYEDGMLNDNVFEVLSFIRNLVDEELVDYYGYTQGVTVGFIRKNTGSVCEYAANALPEHSFSIIRESQQEQISLMNYSSTAYIMLSNTINAKPMINSFINVFLSDIDAHTMLRFGLPGVSYEKNGQNIVLKDANKSNEDLLPRFLLEQLDPELLDPAKMAPLFGTQMTPVYYEEPYYVFYNDYDEYVANYQKRALVDSKAYFDDNPNLFYEIPLLSKGFITTFSVNGSMFSDVAKEIYKNEIAVSDIIEQYKIDSKYFNVLDQLKQINAQLGLKTVYGYDN